MTVKTGDNEFSVSKFIVDSTPGQGTHTTIASALTDASAGDTIFIRTGVYTENLTLKADVNLTAFGCDGIIPPQGGVTKAVDTNVIIKGTCTVDIEGQCCISGIQLQTNGAAALVVSGTNSGQFSMVNASIYSLDADGMTLSNTSTPLNFFGCTFRSTATYSLFTGATAGMDFENCVFQGNAAASTLSAGRALFSSCDMAGITLSCTSTGNFHISACTWGTGGSVLLTTAGTATSEIYNSFIASTSATSVSIGSGTVVRIACTIVSSSNGTAAIDGAGTLEYGYIAFASTSSTVTTSTQTALTVI